jgi:hypothetical protein
MKSYVIVTSEQTKKQSMWHPHLVVTITAAQQSP